MPVIAAAQPLDISVEPSNPGNSVIVPLGQSLNIRTQVEIGSLTVGNPAIADVVPISSTSFNLSGMAVGRTNVVLVGPSGAVAGLLSVEVSPDLRDLETTLRRAAPSANLQIATVNGRLQLSGSVPDSVTLGKVLSIARQYGGEDEIINAIQVSGPQQVLLEVRLIEASRSSGKELGVRWYASDGTTRVFSSGVEPDGAAGTGNVDVGDATIDTRLQSGSAPFGSLLTSVLGLGVEADVLIQALERRGLARRLAEPNLVAKSGQEANFLAGGEVPIPVAQPDGQISVEYKEFGVRLTFTPTVLDGGMINLVMEPEVSQVDNTGGVVVNGLSVPSFTSRRVRTTVELRSGQSFAVAGLLQSSNERTQDQVPLLGSIPVIGALFRSASFQRQETDLVVIVTPRLVDPSRPGVPLATPLDDTRSTNDLEFFFLGEQESQREKIMRVTNGTGVSGSFGHMMDISD
ncbi:type II and III secretion system protein family protein [Meridianimarinicoccus sp. RP-17]|uniref:type II and III secretion system protein family protein n=1 Tax=Meridianimarinicoccus zhengii TaxID=2056810 RepID=UPI000DAD2514|nr:type II and III secretion system protein family protein [Phycocomes zhengii]